MGNCSNDYSHANKGLRVRSIKKGRASWNQRGASGGNLSNGIREASRETEEAPNFCKNDCPTEMVSCCAIV